MKVNKTTEATNLLLSFCYINLLILTKHTQKQTCQHTLFKIL